LGGSNLVLLCRKVADMNNILASSILPSDAEGATLISRIWDPVTQGPRVCLVSDEDLVDITSTIATVSLLAEDLGVLDGIDLDSLQRWSISEVADASSRQDTSKPHFLAPVDLQVVKACGVTFVGSLIERVIEEKCAGDSDRAEAVRAELFDVLGGSLKGVKPGSEHAMAVKKVLLEQGLWSAYLEVGIGPDPEVFTKAPVLSSVGWGAMVGIPSFSTWNNPEPELVLIVNSRGEAVGATLGNDVNLRDVEGRSALLLGKAKDNNAQSSLGPFIRLFDEKFTLETVSSEVIQLSVTGKDGFTMKGTNSVAEISRTLPDLIKAVHGTYHQYPDGFALYTGTLFSPTDDRDVPGSGFTHKAGDRVEISSPHLGSLVNTTEETEKLKPWVFGIRQMFTYLTKIGAQ
jgi:fumarylacetoacetate (FAA) hydrolase family protein